MTRAGAAIRRVSLAAVPAAVIAGAVAAGLPGGLAAQAGGEPPITEETIRHAERIIGLEFTPDERAQLLESQRFFQNLADRRKSYGALRDVELEQSVFPALRFDPGPPGWELPAGDVASVWSDPGEVSRPADLEEVAFWPVGRLAALLRNRQVTSVELTRMYLDRLRRHDPDLHLVVRLLEREALDRAARADREIEAGRYRGPLHGIPYGLKDLFAVEGHPTTWGAEAYRDHTMEGTATVARRLEEAGAVLVAKLSLGALAWGDVWFGGQTRNPWDPEEGSSGSSAGSAAAVSAGLVPFAIGTETWGSIVSPATRTGVTGLRPSFGRVSRAGGMAVSWTMDKVGPLCRTVEDCAIVFDAIRGADGIDRTVVDAPFNYRPGVDFDTLRIGFLASDLEGDYPAAGLDRATVEKLREMGAELVPVELPHRPVTSLAFILAAEAGASFDALTRSNRDDLLARQVADAWPNVLRTARFIPAVEYIQANRVRSLLGDDMRELFARDGIDLYVAPAQAGNNSLVTNLTGHPAVAVPNGFVDPGSPSTITFIGRLYDEAGILAVARAYQEATAFHARHPEPFLP